MSAEGMMKVKNLLGMEIDIDVVDDVCEELFIAFCGPIELTEEGEKHFAEALEYPITITPRCDIAIVHVDDPIKEIWEDRLDKAVELFGSLAGLCTEEEWNTWFILKNDKNVEQNDGLTENQKIGARLKEFRQKNRMTLDYVGKKLGVVQSTVSKWESGANPISIERLQKLTFLYNARLDTILGTSDTEEEEGGTSMKKLTLQEWRRVKGISKEAMAAACKVTTQTITNWEKDPDRIRINQAYEIAKTLDVDIHDIFFAEKVTETATK